MIQRLARTASVLALSAALVACAPVIRTHGYVPVPEKLAQIEVGVDTRGSVQRKIGRPSNTAVFDEDSWFYVSTVIEHFAYYEPEVIDRTVVSVTFDDRDVVASLNSYGLEDGRIIDLASRTTPTYGRELTILEQIFSNLGNVTGDDVLGN
ncbi:MAG: outer membrane protein assembly factor BamE [Pseudomonadota bacterium]